VDAVPSDFVARGILEAKNNRENRSITKIGAGDGRRILIVGQVAIRRDRA